LHFAVVVGIALQVGVIYIPAVNTKVFQHNPLNEDEWAFVVVALAVFMVGAELYKLEKNLLVLLIKLIKPARDTICHC
jgi:predicted anti-sigma-YlaC factor YlaD